MLDWAAEQTRAELWTRAPEDDPRLDERLTNLGFARDGDHALTMLRELDGPLPDVASPDGWTVEEVGGETEWAGRVRDPSGCLGPFEGYSGGVPAEGARP